jgi:hypothetical protein
MYHNITDGANVLILSLIRLGLGEELMAGAKWARTRSAGHKVGKKTQG